MNKTSNIIVNILTEFKGLGNVKKAESAFSGLAGTFKKLAAGYGVEEVVRRSIEAFSANQKQVALLNQTLQNLGLALDSTKVQEYVTKLSEAYGITKEQLIPAFDTLVRSTHDAAKAQSLLQTTLDVSAGTGKDMTAVSAALAKAYAGNNTALSKLGAGLTKTQLQTNSFDKNLKILNATFKGDAKVAADTFQGTINKLKTTTNEAAVAIGESLVNGINALASSNGSRNALSFITTIGDKIAALIYQITKFAIVTKDLFSVKDWFKSGGNIAKMQKDLAALDVQYNKTVVPYKAGLGVTQADAIAKAKGLEMSKQNLKIQNEITKQNNAQLAAQKASAVLKAAGSVVDVQQANIVAALMSAQDPQIIDRLKLQQALLNDNASAAGVLAQKILEAQKEILTLQGKDPFANWGTQTAIDQINNLIAALQNLGIAKAAVGLSGTSAVGTQYTGGTMLASGAIVGVDASGAGVLIPSQNAPSVVNNYINVGGSVVSERALSDVVASNSASGITQNITRLNYNFGQ
jgi:hypothetical protein